MMKLRLRRLVAANMVMLLCLSVSPAQAQNPIRVLLAGRPVELDVPPALIDGRVLVPLRRIFEALGAKVAYDPATGRIVGERGGTTVELQAGRAVAMVNGREVRLSVPAQVVAGRTLVPLRFVSEALGDSVDWDAATGTVHITPAAPGEADREAAAGVQEEAAATPDVAAGPEAPPVQAGWYRIAGTARDARTNAPLAGVRVVARTDHGAAAGGPETPVASDVAAGPAGGAPTTPAPAAAEPAAAAPETAASSGGASSAAAVRRAGPVRALGAPAAVGAPAVGSNPGDAAPSGDGPPPPDGGGGGVTLPVYEFTTQTDEHGAFYLDVPAGASHRVTLTLPCYPVHEFSAGETVQRDIRLEPATAPFTTPLAAGTFRVYGQVKDQDGRPVAGACVVATRPANAPVSAPSATGQVSPGVTQYMTDATGNYFVDWPAWQPVKVKATTAHCDGKGIQLSFVAQLPQPSYAEGGPRNAGIGPPNPEPTTELLTYPATPQLSRDIHVVCVPPPEALPVAVEIPAGAFGNTVCQEEAGADMGTVPLKYTHGAIVTSGSTELTARPLSENPRRVLLRWWLDDDKGGTLYASGCTATYVAPASLGLAYQTSAWVRVAKEGAPRPGYLQVADAGRGVRRILVYDGRNAPAGAATGCNAATYSVAVHGRHGLITRLTIQGVGTWNPLPNSTVTVTNVPVGRYTVTVVANRTHTLQVQVGCPMTRSYID